MTAYWDFRDILDVYPEESPRFNCVCIAPSKGRRCRNPAKDYRRAASILDEMDSLKAPQDSLKLLESLAYASLCQHYHNGLGARGTAYSQVHVMQRQWERSIKAFSKEYAEVAAAKLAQQKAVKLEKAKEKVRLWDQNREESSRSTGHRQTQTIKPEPHTVTVKYELPETKDIFPLVKPADDPFVSDTISKSFNFTMNVPRNRPAIIVPPPVFVVGAGSSSGPVIVKKEKEVIEKPATTISVTEVPCSPLALKKEKEEVENLATTVSVTEVPCSPLTPPVPESSSTRTSSTLADPSQDQSKPTTTQRPLPTTMPAFGTNITMQFGSSNTTSTSFSFVGINATQTKTRTETESNSENKTSDTQQSTFRTPKATKQTRIPYEEFRGQKKFNDQLSTVFDSGKAMDSIKSQNHVTEIQSTPTKAAPVTSQVSEENFGYADVTPQPTRYTTRLPVSSSPSIDLHNHEKLEPQIVVTNLMSEVPARKPLPAVHTKELVPQSAVQEPTVQKLQHSEGGVDEKKAGCLRGLGLGRIKEWVKRKSGGKRGSDEKA